VLVSEKEANLRYVLNFVGTRSASYFLGNFAAELIIFAGISLTLIILSLILGLDAVSKASGSVFLHLMVFAFAYIPLNYVISFLFTKADACTKGA